MADLHFPKSCSYPNGWEKDSGKLFKPANIHDNDDMTYIVEGAKHDP